MRTIQATIVVLIVCTISPPPLSTKSLPPALYNTHRHALLSSPSPPPEPILPSVLACRVPALRARLLPLAIVDQTVYNQVSAAAAVVVGALTRASVLLCAVCSSGVARRGSAGSVLRTRESRRPVALELVAAPRLLPNE